MHFAAPNCVLGRDLGAHAAIRRAAAAADHAAGKGIFATVYFAHTACGAEMLTPQKLTLRLLECFAGDNRLVIVLNIILGQFSQIFRLLFSQKVDGIGLLKQYVAHIFFISEH